MALKTFKPTTPSQRQLVLVELSAMDGDRVVIQHLADTPFEQAIGLGERVVFRTPTWQAELSVATAVARLLGEDDTLDDND